MEIKNNGDEGSHVCDSVAEGERGDGEGSGGRRAGLIAGGGLGRIAGAGASHGAGV